MKNNVVYAIIAAAGSGSRAKQNENKVFSCLGNEQVIFKTVKAFDECRLIDQIIVVYKDGELDKMQLALKSITKKISYVKGGQTRFDSIKNALETIDDGITLIHDGARPYIYKETIERCVLSVAKYGSGVVSAPCVDTVLDTDGKGNILSSSRNGKYYAKTPQGFLTSDIKRAYSLCKDSSKFTDDAGVYCAYVGRCKVVECQENNLKLTYPEDFNQVVNTDIRVGTGFDLHKLVEGRKLILGGIEIEHNKGLLGHSDADVLTHAIMDALLSAVSMRDIGYHFSDKSPEYKDISSMILLDKVMEMLKNSGYAPNNVSAVVMAEKPKMMKYVPSITENLSKALNLPTNKIGISLTTLEGIGIVGREEGIAVQAYCTVKKIDK